MNGVQQGDVTNPINYNATESHALDHVLNDARKKVNKYIFGTILYSYLTSLKQFPDNGIDATKNKNIC